MNSVPELSQDDINRFWSKAAITANPDKCWNWEAGKRRRGYGQIEIKGKNCVTTRVAYYIHYSICPTTDNIILHSCDNPSCVNPNHLTLGTNKDNSIDMMEKGRGKNQFSIGSKHKMAKLTEDQVREIRKLHKEGVKQKDLSIMFKTSNISRIISRQYWQHI